MPNASQRSSGAGEFGGQPGQDAASLGDPQICARFRLRQIDLARKFQPVRERLPVVPDLRVASAEEI